MNCSFIVYKARALLITIILHLFNYFLCDDTDFFQVIKITGSTADTFLEYIQRNIPEGVAMKVIKVQVQFIDLNGDFSGDT